VVDGTETKVTKIKSRYVYELAHQLVKPADTPTTDAEGQSLIDIAQGFRWVRQASAILLVGYVALAPFSGAILWRPHLWLTGGAGSGKSTILNQFVQPLMRGLQYRAEAIRLRQVYANTSGRREAGHLRRVRTEQPT